MLIEFVDVLLRPDLAPGSLQHLFFLPADDVPRVVVKADLSCSFDVGMQLVSVYREHRGVGLGHVASLHLHLFFLIKNKYL